VADPRLEATDTLGRRLVRLEKPIFAIGRRTESDLRVVSSDVSRDHAEIVRNGDGYIVRDRSSRYGTFVIGDGVTERALAHGDRIRSPEPSARASCSPVRTRHSSSRWLVGGAG
jgi:pSer/pThr/pTyr-binding forkhead associated (FHA) protein